MVLVTVDDGDSFYMLIAESLCRWFIIEKQSVTNILNR